MNARPQDVLPSALDNLRAHRVAVARLQGTLAQYNAVTCEHGQLGGTMAMIEAAITAAKAARWPDQTELARLSGELGAAQAASDRFKRKHQTDLARAEQLNREYAAVAAGGKELEAAAILEHAMTSGVESFADSAALWLEGYVEWAACCRAHHLACGRTDPGVPGISFAVKLPVPINSPKSAALDALREPRDLTVRIEARAREILTEIQSA